MARINGNGGNNTLRGGNAGDVIQGFGGNDVLYGNGGNDVIYGGDGRDRLYGGDGSDTLYGGNGADQMFGGTGADVIYGYNGDLMTGGSGGDGFAFTSLRGDQVMINGVRQGIVQGRITDFSRAEGDYIRLSAIDGDASRDGNQAFRWNGYDQNGGPAPAGADPRGVSYRYEPDPDGSGWVTVVDVRNANGAGDANLNGFMQILIDGRIALNPSDFIF